jgi:hypothetical protein
MSKPSFYHRHHYYRHQVIVHDRICWHIAGIRTPASLHNRRGCFLVQSRTRIETDEVLLWRKLPLLSRRWFSVAESDFVAIVSFFVGFLLRSSSLYLLPKSLQYVNLKVSIFFVPVRILSTQTTPAAWSLRYLGIQLIREVRQPFY